MKVAIVGSKKTTEKQLEEAIQASTFKVTSFIVAEQGGIDLLVTDYVNNLDLDVEIDSYAIQWDDLSAENAVVLTNKWGKQYNKNAPANRTAKIIDDCDAMIILDDEEIEANQCKRKIEGTDKPYYVHSVLNKTVAGIALNNEGYIYEF